MCSFIIFVYMYASTSTKVHKAQRATPCSPFQLQGATSTCTVCVGLETGQGHVVCRRLSVGHVFMGLAFAYLFFGALSGCACCHKQSPDCFLEEG